MLTAIGRSPDETDRAASSRARSRVRVLRPLQAERGEREQDRGAGDDAPEQRVRSARDQAPSQVRRRSPARTPDRYP